MRRVQTKPQDLVVHGLRQHRSEEHTSELQSRLHLVCRLLLEKKNTPRPLPPFPVLLATSPHRAQPGRASPACPSPPDSPRRTPWPTSGLNATAARSVLLAIL